MLKAESVVTLPEVEAVLKGTLGGEAKSGAKRMGRILTVSGVHLKWYTLETE